MSSNLTALIFYQNKILLRWWKGQCHQTIFTREYYRYIKPPNLGSLDESRDSNENFNISDSKLRELLPPQMQLIWKKIRDLCAFEISFNQDY